MAEQMSIYDGVKTHPRLLVEAACAWAAEGYGVKDCRFFKMVRLCERAMAEGLPLIRRGDLFYLAKDQGFDMTLCREFKFDNNLWAPLSRYILMFRPSLAHVIHPKKSDIDSLDFERIWHEQVNPHTFFYAHNWQEAVRMCEMKDIAC